MIIFVFREGRFIHQMSILDPGGEPEARSILGRVSYLDSI
jgi:hypothetical protein